MKIDHFQRGEYLLRIFVHWANAFEEHLQELENLDLLDKNQMVKHIAHYLINFFYQDVILDQSFELLYLDQCAVTQYSRGYFFY